VVSFWTFFLISQQPERIRKNQKHQKILLMQGDLSKVIMDNSLFSFKYFSFMTRRQRAYVMIVLLWIIPIIYAVIPPAGWNCAQTCQCLSECFPSNHTFIPSDLACSRVFPPMTNAWLSLVVVSWLCGVVITIWMLKR